MQSLPCVTVPISCVLTLYCAAIASTRARDAAGSETITRAPRSPKESVFGGLPAGCARFQPDVGRPSLLEAGFCQGHRQAAVAHVMRGHDHLLACEGD